MSDFRAVASWCEHRTDRHYSVVWYPTSIAYYPRDEVELAGGLLAGALEGPDVTPNPGSDAARERGCICAVFDNNHGRRLPWTGGWWITEGCPVHAPEGAT